MVSEFSDGKISRSMVRIPGSGSNHEEAGIVCLNLGNVSRLAAMIPVPQSLSFTNQNGIKRKMKSSFNLDSAPNKLRQMDENIPAGLIRVNPELIANTSAPSPLPQDTTTITRQVNGIRSQEPVGPSWPVRQNTNRSSTLKRPAQPEVSRNREQCSQPKKPCVQPSSSIYPQIVQGNAENVAVNSNTILLPTFVPQNHTLPSGMVQGYSHSLANGLFQVSSQAIPVVLPHFNASNGTSQSVNVEIPTTNVNIGSVSSSAEANASPRIVPVLIPAGMPKINIKQLLYERQMLRKQNEAMKRNLYRFQQLFKNKEKLQRFLRNMEAASHNVNTIESAPHNLNIVESAPHNINTAESASHNVRNVEVGA